MAIAVSTVGIITLIQAQQAKAFNQLDQSPARHLDKCSAPHPAACCRCKDGCRRRLNAIAGRELSVCTRRTEIPEDFCAFKHKGKNTWHYFWQFGETTPISNKRVEKWIRNKRYSHAYCRDQSTRSQSEHGIDWELTQCDMGRHSSTDEWKRVPVCCEKDYRVTNDKKNPFWKKCQIYYHPDPNQRRRLSERLSSLSSMDVEEDENDTPPKDSFATYLAFGGIASAGLILFF